MASTFTTNLHLELQGTGDNSGTWGSVLNTADFTIIDNVLGGVQTLSLSNVNVTVTTVQSQNNTFKLTGALTGNVIITFPAIGRTIFVVNSTTGNFSVTLACAGAGTSTVITQGRNGFFVLDAVNVIAQTDTGTPIGQVAAFAMSSVPTGWLECNGAAISRSTFSALFALVSTTYGPGNGVTTFNIPDMRGYFARGWSHGSAVDSGRALGSTQAAAFASHLHTFTGNQLAPHNHDVHAAGARHGSNGTSLGASFPAADGDQFTNTTAPTLTTTSDTAGTPTGAIGLTGGTETRPINLALMFCIRVT